MNIQFTLTEDQSKKVADWIGAQGFCAQGAIGGQFTYEFTPTTLGVVQKVSNIANGQELDVTEYGDW